MTQLRVAFHCTDLSIPFDPSVQGTSILIPGTVQHEQLVELSKSFLGDDADLPLSFCILHPIRHPLLTATEPDTDGSAIEFPLQNHGTLLESIQKAYKRFACAVETSESVFHLRIQRIHNPVVEQTERLTDWIGCFSRILDDRMIVGCYDGTVQQIKLNNQSFEMCPLKRGANKSPVKSAVWLPTNPDRFVYGTMNGQLRFVQPNVVDGAKETVVDKAHDGTVAGLCSYEELLISVGWDGAINLWNDVTRLSTVTSAHESKICACAFLDSTLFTTGWDGICKQWDLEATQQPSQVNHVSVGTPINCMDVAQHQIVTGGTDGLIRGWDPRTKATTNKFGTHSKWINEIRLCPWNDWIVASCGADSLIKIWDMRWAGKVSVHSIKFDCKILALQWLSEPTGSGLLGRLAYGGEDNLVGVVAL